MNNNSDQKIEQYLLDILYSLDGKLSKINFNRIKKHYKWNLNFKKIHIVGTNGKGSNAKFINDELIKQGYRVGLFTSPHIYSMYERIKVNNNNIHFETMTKFVSRLKSDFIDINFGWFDVFFLCALNFFENSDIDVGVFEAGIGAKKDIVNYINHDYLLITSIGLDHEKILGNNLEKIAIDKSFAIKKNVNVFISNDIDKKIIDIFSKKAEKEKCTFKIINVKNQTYETINKSFSQSFLQSAFNIKEFKSKFILPVGRGHEIEINNIKCFVDVAHNEEGIIKSIEYYEKNKKDISQVVLSLSNDKNYKKISKILTNKYKIIYVYENKGRKPLKLFDYDEKFPKILNLKYFLKKLDSPTLFIGSFYLVSEILQEI